MHDRVGTRRGGKRNGSGRKPKSQEIQRKRVPFPEMGKREAREFVEDLNRWGIWESFIIGKDRKLAFRAWIWLNEKAYGKNYTAVNPDLFQAAKHSDPSSDPRMSQLMTMLRTSAPVTLTQTKTTMSVGQAPQITVAPAIDCGDNVTSPAINHPTNTHPSTQKPPTPEVALQSPPQFFQKPSPQNGEEKEADDEWESAEGLQEEQEREEPPLTLAQKAALWDEFVTRKKGHRGKSKLRTKNLEPEGVEEVETPTKRPRKAQKASKAQEGAL